ncbi:hypothetical protein DOTSEDRAFT_67153 [Dothistroma septosporum NZE10]|uniref:NAD(P)-binding protein n=1 Tax=Dothistroma septosporum (strain NZE10 / CBS 128990) TaxID=675120 RepID=N1PBR0_DOTSN|nr:hypothetical protein DOTSEDRAFT_67153 [Dothistroma septosporum NZE10]
MDAIKNTLGLNNTFDPNKDIPDLSGKTYVVTGGSAGIGFGICAHLLQHNCAALYLLGKKEEHLTEAQEGLKKYGDTSKVHPIQIELEDLRHTDQVAKRLKDELTQLDGLILNAGLGVGPYNESKDGIDTHMQVNVLAQHHLMMVLLATLAKTPDSRIALQSSDLHRPAPSDTAFASVAELNQDIGAMNLYNRSKLAQVLLVRALHRRKQQSRLGLIPSSSPWINATHPGAVSTDQQEQAIEAYGTPGKLGVKAVRPFMKDPLDEGCRPILFAVTAREVGEEKIDGAYIVPDRKVTEPSKQAKDEELGERLWRLTKEILENKIGDLPYAM